MAARIPAVVAAEAARLDLGRFERRYHGHVPLHRYFGVVLTGFGLFLLCMGAPWYIVIGLFLLPGGAFLTYATLSRVNTGFFLYERGFVQVGVSGKVKFVVRWIDVSRTSNSHVVVQGGIRAIHHVRYMVHLRDGRMTEFGLQHLRDAQELYDIIENRHRKTAR